MKKLFSYYRQIPYLIIFFLVFTISFGFTKTIACKQILCSGCFRYCDTLPDKNKNNFPPPPPPVEERKKQKEKESADTSVNSEAVFEKAEIESSVDRHL